MKFSKDLFKINKGVVLIKLEYALFNFGMTLIFPYLTLQLRSFGLSYEDISYIYGFIPLLTFFSSPVTGFIGDKVGYRLILIINIILTGVSATCFQLTPSFGENIKVPTATIYSNDSYSSQYSLLSVQWPLCNETVNEENCNSFPPFLNKFEYLPSFLSCETAFDESDFNEDYFLTNATTFEAPNGTFCFTQNEDAFNETGFFQECETVNYPSMPFCKEAYGSHAKTFWTYFAMRTVFQWTMNSAFSLQDATTLKITSEQNSDYSYVMMWNTLASFLAPFLAGQVIKDPPEGSNEQTDYSMAFYICDGFLLISSALTIFLTVNMEKSGEKVWKSLKKIASVPALNFFAIVFVTGFLWGIHDTYLFIYLDEELGASSELISYMVAAGTGSGMLIMFVAKPVVNFFGETNCMVLGIWVEASRLVIYALVKQSPPYYAIALHTLDAFVWVLPWIGTMRYGYKIAPPDYIATMAATIGAIEFIIAKGLASLIAGQILAHSSWETPELFIFSAICAISASALLLINYHLLIKPKYEKKVLEDKAELLKRMEEAKKAATNVKIGDDSKENKKEEEVKGKESTSPPLRRSDSFFTALGMASISKAQNIYITEL